MKTFYFKKKIIPFEVIGKLLLAKTELGDIKIEGNKLYVPSGYDKLYTYLMIYYVYDFNKRCWLKQRGRVLQKVNDEIVITTYKELLVQDMLFFTIICSVTGEEFNKEILVAMKKTLLRERREKDCYSIINRGKLWYDRLTVDQLMELDKWYKDWLNVTETLRLPPDLDWINNKLEEEDIL